MQQLNIILYSELDVIIDYYYTLATNSSIDVLAGQYINKANLLCEDPIHIHLLISADGASFYNTKKLSFWPIQAIILDNYLLILEKKLVIFYYYLYGLVIRNLTGNVMTHIISNCNQTFDFIINGIRRTVSIHIYLYIYDLPALY